MDRFFAGPAGYPVPADMGLFKFLMMVTASAHLVFFYFLFGAALIGLFHFFRQNSGGVSRQIVVSTTRLIPALFTFTVVTALLPLFLTQVVYGQALYPAVIAHGTQWLVAGVLALALYVYLRICSGRSDTSGQPIWIALALTTVIAGWFSWLVTNTSSLMLSPSAVQSVLLGEAAGPYSHGLSIFLPSWFWFISHSLMGGFLLINTVAMFNEQTEDRDAVMEHGFYGFTVSAVLAILLMFWWLLMLPQTSYDRIIDGHIFLIYITSVVFAVPIIVLANKIHEKGIFVAGLVPAFFIIVMQQWMAMIATDDALIPGLINHDQITVQPDYGNLFLFVFLLVVGIWYATHLAGQYVKFKKSN
ncbi:MAG: hypothetical protein HUU10_08955 [Bacteroidetes bacterium]|nr:hypothetical protein [Bacteroidota bacterium]